MTASNAKVTATPKGLRGIIATIATADVTAAIAFYTDVFKAEVTDTLTAPNSDIILHAQVKVAGTPMFITQDATALPYAGTGHVTLHHYLEDIETTYEAAISAGAVPVAPVALAWWGDLNAVFVDPFGVRWNLAKRVERLNSEDRAQRLADLYAPEAPAEAEAAQEEAPVAEAASDA